jgi:hypothetical protein
MLSKQVNHSASPFLCWIFLRIGSPELFGATSFEPWSFWSLHPEYLRLQEWATTAWLVCVTFTELWPNHLREQLKRGRIFFGSQFQGVQPMVSWPMCLGRVSWQQECVVENVLQLMLTKKQRLEPGITFKGSPHLLKFPEPPKIVPPTRDQAPWLEAFGGTLQIQTIRGLCFDTCCRCILIKSG